MKLSIIIPVYNTEKFLRKCIESVYEENPMPIENFEVIAVNDGSPDDSHLILNEYEQKYSNFIVVTQENQGLSAARNNALKIAKGDYVYFLDSDDFMDPSALSRALENGLSHQANLIIVDYVKVNEDGDMWDRQDVNVYKDLPPMVVSYDLLNNYSVRAAACSYLYDRSFLESKLILFTIGIYHEDEEFTIRYISSRPTIYYSREIVYYYTQRIGSIVHPTSDKKKIKLLNDLLYVGGAISEMAEQTPDVKIKRGLGKKASQIAIGFFIKLHKAKINKEDKKDLLSQFAGSSLYPIRRTGLKSSQQLFAIFANLLVWILK